MASTLTTTDETPDASGLPGAGERVLLFRVADRVYGCPIEAVREIVPYRAATRLPGAPAYVQGLINLRGILATVIDLGAWIDPARVPLRRGSIVLVDHGARQAGILVDEVLDVQTVRPEPLDDTVGAREGVLRGVGRLDETVVILLDVTTLVRQVLV